MKIVPDSPAAPTPLQDLLKAKLAGGSAEQCPSDRASGDQAAELPSTQAGTSTRPEYVPLTEAQGRTIYAKFLGRLTYSKDGAEPNCKRYLGSSLFDWVARQPHLMAVDAAGFSWQRSACDFLASLMENVKHLEDHFAAERPNAAAACARIDEATKDEGYLKYLTPAGVNAHCRAQAAASLGNSLIATSALRTSAVKSAVLAAWAVVKSGACEFTLLSSLSAAWDAYTMFAIDSNLFLTSSVPGLAKHLADLERNKENIRAAVDRAESRRAEGQMNQQLAPAAASAVAATSPSVVDQDEGSRPAWTPPEAASAAATVPGPGLDEPSHDSWPDMHETFTTNPANGLPMMGGMGGLDVHGNSFGTSFDDPF